MTFRQFFSSLHGSAGFMLIARGLLALWLSPLMIGLAAAFTFTAAPKAAHAQTAIQTVVVLDFNVGPGLDPGIGRKAADALAVELQRSGAYEVVTREQVERAVNTQPGLRPPFNEATQARLAQAVGARSVFSGRVARAEINNRRSARVSLEVRQLDAATLDYINGTFTTETTEDKLTAVDNDVLLDEAINKAANTSVRQLRTIVLPIGTVLNVTSQDVELNIGARDGAISGQRYSVLRDIFNKSSGQVERYKIAELSISRVESDQSTARLARDIAGIGVRTGDKVRQIFVANANYPVSANPSASNSSGNSPLSGGRKKGRFSKGLIGLVALAALVAFAGFGGSSKNDPAVTSPGTVRATPVGSSFNSPRIRVDYRAGLPSILTTENIVGYLIYRDTNPNFNPDLGTLQDFVEGNTTRYLDGQNPNGQRVVTIDALTGNNQTAGRNFSITANNLTFPPLNTNTQSITQTRITLSVTVDPPFPGQQYFYRVQRITAITTAATAGNTSTTTTRLAVSNTSPVSGGATALVEPEIVDSSADLDAFTVSINAVFPFGPIPTPAPTPVPRPVTTGFDDVDRFIVQVSSDRAFRAGSTFERIFTRPNVPAVDANGNLTFDLGRILVPGFDPTGAADQLFVFVRVGVTNTRDQPGATIFSNAEIVRNLAGGTNTAARFAPAPAQTAATARKRRSRSRVPRPNQRPRRDPFDFDAALPQ